MNAHVAKSLAKKRKVKTFHDLEVWQKAHCMTLAIYRLTRAFPQEERYGLTSQMRRAAASVPANIVEGFQRNTRKEKLHFYSIARGSLGELEYYLILAKDLGYLKKYTSPWLKSCDDLSRMLMAFSRTAASK